MHNVKKCNIVAEVIVVAVSCMSHGDNFGSHGESCMSPGNSCKSLCGSCKLYGSK